MCKSPGSLGRRRSQLVLAVARPGGKTRTGGSERPCRAVGAAGQGTPRATAGQWPRPRAAGRLYGGRKESGDEMTTPEPKWREDWPVWTPTFTRSEPLGHCHLLTAVLAFLLVLLFHRWSHEISSEMLANSI